MPSFDIESEVNKVELKNASDQANLEIAIRFDFKGSDARIEQNYLALTLDAVDARGRDQGGQTVDELQGREAQLRGAIVLRPREAIDNLVVMDLFQPLQRKGRARTGTYFWVDPQEQVVGICMTQAPSPAWIVEFGELDLPARQENRRKEVGIFPDIVKRRTE
jgi:hypothetical protein